MKTINKSTQSSQGGGVLEKMRIVLNKILFAGKLSEMRLSSRLSYLHTF